jgi:hypothetical protein
MVALEPDVTASSPVAEDSSTARSHLLSALNHAPARQQRCMATRPRFWIGFCCQRFASDAYAKRRSSQVQRTIGHAERAPAAWWKS